MGDKPIEQFEKGDEILSRPEDSPYAPARKSYVEEVFELSGDTLVLRTGGQSITTTEKHPFYIVGKGWVRGGLSQATRSRGTTAKRPPSNRPSRPAGRRKSTICASPSTGPTSSAAAAGFLDLGA